MRVVQHGGTWLLIADQEQAASLRTVLVAFQINTGESLGPDGFFWLEKLIRELPKEPR